jgi:hypothetical protein
MPKVSDHPNRGEARIRSAVTAPAAVSRHAPTPPSSSAACPRGPRDEALTTAGTTTSPSACPATAEKTMLGTTLVAMNVFAKKVGPSTAPITTTRPSPVARLINVQLATTAERRAATVTNGPRGRERNTTRPR